MRDFLAKSKWCFCINLLMRQCGYCGYVEYCTLASGAETRRHLHSAGRHLQTVLRFLLNTHITVRLILLLTQAQWSGTLCQISSRTQRSLQGADTYLRDTSAPSALEVLTLMCYINLLAHSLTQYS